MEIYELKLAVSEQGINSLLDAYLPEDAAVENVCVRIAPEGVFIQGNYPTVFGKVPFETQWEMRIVGGQVHSRLAALKVSGVPGNLFRKMVLDQIREVLANEQGIELEDDTLRIDVETIAQSKSVLLRCNLRDLRCEPGRLLLIAGRD
jgi:hypothetical protein